MNWPLIIALVLNSLLSVAFGNMIGQTIGRRIGYNEGWEAACDYWGVQYE